MMGNKYFIIEGGNSTGKSTLIDGLKMIIPNAKTIYSIPEEYNELRQFTYNKWSDKASLFFYLSANMEVINKLDANFVIFDRSIISTFSIYLSRLDENKWESILPLYKEFMKMMPKIRKIYFLTATKEIRLIRINEKIGNHKEADLKEIGYEEKKDKARLFLLNNSNFNFEKIDTSHLAKDEVLRIVFESINNDTCIG